MTDADRLLAARFEATREQMDDADWDDVLRRHPHRRTHRQRRWTLAVALIAVGIPVAVAVAGRVRDAFFGTPAPPVVKQAFVQENQVTRVMRNWQKAHGVPVRTMPLIDAAKAHGVAAVRTPDGLLMLWAAPARSGHGECWFIDFAVDQLRQKSPEGGGSCDPGTRPAHPISPEFGWSAAHPTLKVLAGRVYPSAVAVTVEFPNRPPATLPVIDHYFLAAYPRSTRMPTKFTVVNSHGQAVATLTTR
jgi:hypothetical protein